MSVHISSKTLCNAYNIKDVDCKADDQMFSLPSSIAQQSFVVPCCKKGVQETNADTMWWAMGVFPQNTFLTSYGDYYTSTKYFFENLQKLYGDRKSMFPSTTSVSIFANGNPDNLKTWQNEDKNLAGILTFQYLFTAKTAVVNELSQFL